MGTCEACGGDATGNSRLTGTNGGVDRNEDIRGALVCGACISKYTRDEWNWAECYSHIRARRAEQQGPVVVDADGVQPAEERRGSKCDGHRHVGGWEILGRNKQRCCGCNTIEEKCECCGTFGDTKPTEDGANLCAACYRACPTEEDEAPAQPPGPSLADFTAAVNQHLLPRLPEGFKAITDSVANELWFIWIHDATGAEIHFAQYSSGWQFTDGNAAAISTIAAERLLTRTARTQPQPPKPPSEWESYAKVEEKQVPGWRGSR